jgi:uncharacterized Zn-binding protein involved in type VI secretion
MFGSLVADGDRTSTGGVVFGYSGMSNEKGRAYARKENKATCGNCKGAWPIYGTASDWMDDGQPMVKDGDRVLCPCGKNFVFAASNSTAFYSESKGNATVTPVPETPVYDQRYELRDSDGRPLAGVRYRIVANDGRVITGTTNACGQTERVITRSASNLRLQLEK